MGEQLPQPLPVARSQVPFVTELSEKQERDAAVALRRAVRAALPWWARMMLPSDIAKIVRVVCARAADFAQTYDARGGDFTHRRWYNEGCYDASARVRRLGGVEQVV